MAPWVRGPDIGGRKIPPAVHDRTRERILAYAAKHYAGKYTRLDIRFRGQFCYIDAYREPFVPRKWPPKGWPTSETRAERIEQLRNIPTHLCRLRYFGDEEAWGFAFYTYSHEKYELCVLDSGSFYGTPEECFAAAAVYLED